MKRCVMNCKRGGNRWPSVKTLPPLSRGMRAITVTLCQDIWCSAQVLNTPPFEYNPEALRLGPKCSVT